MESEFEIMEKINIRNKCRIFIFGKWDEFKRQVKTYLLEEYKSLFPNIDYYYASFHFHYNMDHLQKHMRYMENKQGMSYQIAKDSMESLISSSLDKTIYNTHTKAKQEIPFIANLDDKKSYQGSDTYITEQTLIKNSIIHQDYEEIKINEQLKFHIDNVEIPF